MPGVTKIDIASSTIFRTILILVGFWFLYVIRDILLMLLAAIVVATAIEPVAHFLKRYRVPRAVSVLLVYLVAIGIISLAVTLLIPPLTEQVGQLAQSVPQLIEKADEWLTFVSLDRESTATQAQDFLNRFGERIANTGLNLFQQTRDVFSGFFSFLFVFIIAFYFVAEEDALKKFFRVIMPKAHAPYVERIIDRAQHKIARWILGQLILGLVVGTIVGLGLWIIGVKYALVLGLLAGIMEIIPVIGPIIAAVPGVVIAATQSWVLGLVALGFYILVQQAENHILVPNIMRRAVGLSPLVTLIAVLLGARLAGVAGVILAVPVATMIGIFFSDLFDRTGEGPVG